MHFNSSDKKDYCLSVEDADTDNSDHERRIYTEEKAKVVASVYPASYFTRENFV